MRRIFDLPGPFDFSDRSARAHSGAPPEAGVPAPDTVPSFDADYDLELDFDDPPGDTEPFALEPCARCGAVTAVPVSLLPRTKCEVCKAPCAPCEDVRRS